MLAHQLLKDGDALVTLSLKHALESEVENESYLLVGVGLLSLIIDSLRLVKLSLIQKLNKFDQSILVRVEWRLRHSRESRRAFGIRTQLMSIRYPFVRKRHTSFYLGNIVNLIIYLSN